MISSHDFYNVMTAMVPLYVAMLVAYAAVRWWKLFTPEQCSGINRFVASFAVPLLSFHFISSNNPYKINLLFAAADTLQKLIVLALLAVWAAVSSSSSSSWVITVFSVTTLPNTLVMGIPLLVAMYGEDSGAGALMVQIVVLQCIVWYTLLLFLFEFRGAKALIVRDFPNTAASIAAITVESDVISFDGSQLETESNVATDGRLHVIVRRSTSSALAGAEIYSVSSGATPRALETFLEAGPSMKRSGSYSGGYWYSGRVSDFEAGEGSLKKSRSGYSQTGRDQLHMFRWSCRGSPEIGMFGGGRVAAVDDGSKEARVTTSSKNSNRDSDHQEDSGREEATVVADKQMPATSVMTRLILMMVWRKLIRNPNTYSSITGLIWSFISFRWNIEMPRIIANSISILSNAGLGMAMFSLGLFMALQPKLIACGNGLALFSMALRFIVGPAIAAVSSITLGIRGNLLKISILQAALPQGIVPFVFAKEYNNHPTVLSTGVIFGMLVALPIDLLYYVLLEL